jgi:amino-acid N-acetyltransferase
MQKSEIRVRRATMDDWKDIKSLVRAFPKQLMQSDVPEVESFFVGLIDGKIVGCCALQIHSGRLGEVRSLAVRKNFQGRGVGRRLVARCVSAARQKSFAAAFYHRPAKHVSQTRIFYFPKRKIRDVHAHALKNTLFFFTFLKYLLYWI